MRLDEEQYKQKRDKEDRDAARILESLAARPCCCERIDQGWQDAGCKFHRPVRSWAKATDWMGGE